MINFAVLDRRLHQVGEYYDSAIPRWVANCRHTLEVDQGDSQARIVRWVSRTATSFFEPIHLLLVSHGGLAGDPSPAGRLFYFVKLGEGLYQGNVREWEGIKGQIEKISVYVCGPEEPTIRAAAGGLSAYNAMRRNQHVLMRKLSGFTGAEVIYTSVGQESTHSPPRFGRIDSYGVGPGEMPSPIFRTRAGSQPTLLR